MSDPLDFPWKDRPWLSLDLETTGPNPSACSVVQVALVTIEQGRPTSVWESLVNPEVPIPDGARAVHGISDADVADAPTIHELRSEILSRVVECSVLIAYAGLRFDFPILHRLLPQVPDHSGEPFPLGFRESCRGRLVLDALVVVRHETVGKYWKNADRAYPDKGRHTLLNAAARSGVDFDPDTAHGAAPDAVATGGILWRWKDRLPDDARGALRWTMGEASGQDAEYQRKKREWDRRREQAAPDSHDHDERPH